MNCLHCAARCSKKPSEWRETFTRQTRVGRSRRTLRSAPHCDATVGSSERGEIVDAVADHDGWSRERRVAYEKQLRFRCQFTVDLMGFESNLASNVKRDCGMITASQMNRPAARAKCGDGCARISSNRITDSNQRNDAITSRNEYRRNTRSSKGICALCEVVRHSHLRTMHELKRSNCDTPTKAHAFDT